MSVFVSLNGPDNTGKTTQLRRLAQARTSCAPLGSIHEHDPQPWVAVSAHDYGRWWFETSTTRQLTTMLLTGHAHRARALPAGSIGLLDRGAAMLLAAAAATCSVKEEVDLDDALAKINAIARDQEAPAPEIGVLLLPSLDTERSLRITAERQKQPWTGVYHEYQRRLHRTLLRQAESGAYDVVIDCENRGVDDVQAEVLRAYDNRVPPPVPDSP